MRVAVLSDIHGNWQALEAVIEDAAGVDGALCLGDIVGYGADPVRCLDEVRGRGWPALVGNHDRACTDEHILSWFNDEAARVIRWTRAQIGDERRDWLARLPVEEVEETSGVLLLHGSPRDPIFEYILDTATADANLDVLGSRVCFHGHSHVPGWFRRTGAAAGHGYHLGAIRLEGPMLVNPGSVGQPRDGNPDASYGVWDVEEQTFEWRRVAYDRAGAQQAILDAGLPARFASRLDAGH